MIEVLQAGLFSTIQDLGRPGYRKFGIPLSGVMDVISANLANGLLNNNVNDPVLELTLIGPKLQFNKSTYIVITGANMSPKLNNTPILNYKVYKVSEGDVLSFGKLLKGTRSYVAIKGGFETHKVLESHSFYKNITKVYKVEKNQKLSFKPIVEPLIFQKGVVNNKVKFYETNELEVYKGPEFDRFNAKEQEKILDKTYTVSSHFNRMGYRLTEVALPHKHTIITGPVMPGTVQLTTAGKLIVLMKDAQTTGGYARVFQLTERSISILAQKKTGDQLVFKLKSY